MQTTLTTDKRAQLVEALVGAIVKRRFPPGPVAKEVLRHLHIEAEEYADAITALQNDPVRCPGCDEWRLRAFAAEDENKRLLTALRVNGLRWGYTHAEINAMIADQSARDKPRPADCGNRMNCGWHKAQTEPDINLWLCHDPNCGHGITALSSQQPIADKRAET